MRRRKEKRLYVSQSQLPGAGSGLFANVDFKKGDRITEYAGPLRKWSLVKNQDGYNGYLLRINDHVAIDARPSKTFGRFANDAAGFSRVKGLRNNAEFLIYGCYCHIEATRPIKKGEEIFVDYGKEFWEVHRKLKQHLPARSTSSGTHQSAH